MRRSGILTGLLCARLIWAAAIEPLPIPSEPPCASLDDIPEELLTELLGIGAECPACGKAPWAVQSLDYEAEEFAYKRPCGHGGYNDMATVVTGQCTAVCASCGHTETLDMDEDIVYCPMKTATLRTRHSRKRERPAPGGKTGRTSDRKKGSA